MKYCIQQNFFSSVNLENLVSFLTLSSRDFEILPVFYNREVESKFAKEKEVFAFGGSYFASKIAKYNWTPGSLMSSKYSFEYCKDIYKDLLLNYDSQILSVFDSICWTFDRMFIRPCLDSKLFTGALFSEFDWNEMQQAILEKIQKGFIKDSDLAIQVSTPKEIVSEFRCWIVNGEVLDICSYRFLSNATLSKSLVDSETQNFASQIAKIYFDKAFVCDVAKLKDSTFKIVEINCLSASSFYLCNIGNLIESLENIF